MQRIEIAIMRIEAEPGAKPEKVEVPRKGYRLAVVYVLEDGVRQPAHFTTSLLRNAKAELASLPKAPTNPMSALYGDGRFYGTSTSFSLLPRAGAR